MVVVRWYTGCEMTNQVVCWAQVVPEVVLKCWKLLFKKYEHTSKDLGPINDLTSLLPWSSPCTPDLRVLHLINNEEDLEKKNATRE